MKNFEDIQNIWSDNQSQNTFSDPSLADRKKDRLSLLRKQYRLGAIGLIGVTAFFIWFGFLSDRSFQFDVSYASMALISTCLVIMTGINLYNLFLVSKIDETVSPREYVKAWSKLYRNRFHFFRLYSPVLALIFYVSFGLYLPEILHFYPSTAYKIGFVLFILILFAGNILLSRKAIKKEKVKLNEIDRIYKMLLEEAG